MAQAKPSQKTTQPEEETKQNYPRKDAPGQKEPEPGITRRTTSEPSLWSASPFSFMRRFSEEMDRLFEDFGFGPNRISGFGAEIGRGLSGVWSPPIEMFERGDKLVVRADLPGLKKEDVKVEFNDGALTITGERRYEQKEGEGGRYRTERSYGSFYRAIRLPEGVNPDNANATFRDGVLEIEMPAPTPPESRGRRIEIKS